MDQLIKLFVNDSWNLFKSYVETIRSTMIDQHFTKSDQNSIILRIISFFEDFVEEKNLSTISSSDVISFIEETGSPLQIISSLKIHSTHLDDEKSTFDDVCILCFSLIPDSAKQCGYCGNSYRPQDNPFLEFIVNHLLMVASLFSFLIAILLTTIYNFLTFPPKNLTTDFIDEFFLQSVISIPVFSGTILGTLFIGIFLSLLLNNYRKPQFNRKANFLVNDFQFFFGFALLLLGSFASILSAVYFVFDIIWTNYLESGVYFVFLVIFISIFTILIGYFIWNYSYKPKTFNYMYLRHYSYRLNPITIKNLSYYVLFLFGISIVIFPLVFIFPSFSQQPLRIFGFLIGLLIILSGIFFCYRSSWKNFPSMISLVTVNNTNHNFSIQREHYLTADALTFLNIYSSILTTTLLFNKILTKHDNVLSELWEKIVEVSMSSSSKRITLVDISTFISQKLPPILDTYYSSYLPLKNLIQIFSKKEPIKYPLFLRIFNKINLLFLLVRVLFSLFSLLSKEIILSQFIDQCFTAVLEFGFLSLVFYGIFFFFYIRDNNTEKKSPYQLANSLEYSYIHGLILLPIAFLFPCILVSTIFIAFSVYINILSPNGAFSLAILFSALILMGLPVISIFLGFRNHSSRKKSSLSISLLPIYKELKSKYYRRRVYASIISLFLFIFFLMNIDYNSSEIYLLFLPISFFSMIFVINSLNHFSWKTLNNKIKSLDEHIEN